MRASRVTLALFGVLAPSVAAAEPPTAASVAAPTEEVAVDEVIRAVRQELMALVARDAMRDDDALLTEPAPQDIVVGELPASMTSAAPAARSAAQHTSKDLSWLEGLALPDFGIRWDDRLVRLLEHYKNDARGQAQMRTLLARQGRYGDMMREKLRAASLPEDLVYVAMVESSFEPSARSEVGAVGLWQFMSVTASGYDLEMSRWVDQRMHPERSTDAATKFFRELHDQLGSWPLAMAAFNMGYGGLLRAIQKYNTNDFWLLSTLEAGLPYETITYVTKIAAFAIIGKNPERFGLTDLKRDPALRAVEVEVPGGTTLLRVARAAGMPVEELAAWNPDLKKTRVPPDVKAWPLRLPEDRVARFTAKWAGYQPTTPYREHVLRLGERLTEVATAYGTTLARLQALNQVEGDRLRAGTKIKVPDVEPTPLPRAETPAVGVSGDAFVYADRQRVFYRICEGDDLTEIASFFGINADEIRLWNRISPEAKPQRGMYLQLYVPKACDLTQALVLTPDEVRTVVVGSEEFFDFHETQQNRVRLRYRVKPGDTMRSLAERFDLSVGSIARINQFSRDKKLAPDSEIIVYVPQDSAKKLVSR